LPSTKREVRMYTHMIMSKAAECDLDSQGRIRIPAHLTQEAKLHSPFTLAFYCIGFYQDYISSIHYGCCGCIGKKSHSIPHSK
ncbi:hypothetical protein PT148_09085, partial [Erysipelothrix rhusiopathiae]|nr:hypothetical protein [Erysipelothrix rhusiopathiae]